jgi:dynein heavy chain 1, cytosolic
MGQRILYGLTSLMGVEEIDLSLSTERTGQLKSGLDTVSSWIAQLSEALNQVPKIDLSFSSDVGCSPLQRCLAREIAKGKGILSSVLDDLSFVRCPRLQPLSLTPFLRSFYLGEVKSTNAIRDLLSCFLKGTVPQQWRSHYAITARTTVGSWISNLASRCSFLQHYSSVVLETVPKTTSHYWLGGLFSPEGFITATRQTTAQVFLTERTHRLIPRRPIIGALRSLSFSSKSAKTEPKEFKAT